MKVILSVPDEGYSRSVWCALNLISTFLLNKLFIYKTNQELRIISLIKMKNNNGLRTCLISFYIALLSDNRVIVFVHDINKTLRRQRLKK